MSWNRRGAKLTLIYEQREQLRLDDEDGTVELMLDLLRHGSQTVEELAFAVGVPMVTVEQTLGVLDQHGLLVDDEYGRQTDSICDHPVDAGSFFARHTTVEVSADDMLDRLYATNAMIIGRTPIGTEVAMQLATFGVRRLTLVDPRTTSRFGGSYVHAPFSNDVPGYGLLRICELIRQIDPRVEVNGVQSIVDEPAALGCLLDSCAPDIVVCDLGRAVGADPLVNAACVNQRVPLVGAALGQAGALVHSVDPGRSACTACVTSGHSKAQDAYVTRLLHEQPSPALRVPPAAAILGSLVVLEVLRYVTGFEPPAYAGQPMHVEFGAGGMMRRLTWRRDPACLVCNDPAPQ